jgi:hypothetical protein
MKATFMRMMLKGLEVANNRTPTATGAAGNGLSIVFSQRIAPRARAVEIVAQRPERAVPVAGETSTATRRRLAGRRSTSRSTPSPAGNSTASSSPASTAVLPAGAATAGHIHSDSTRPCGRRADGASERGIAQCMAACWRIRTAPLGNCTTSPTTGSGRDRPI